MASRLPSFDTNVFSIADLKDHAGRSMDKSLVEYYNGASMDELTLQDNETSFNRYKLRPRCLVDVSNVDTSTTFLGNKIRFPFGFSPAAWHCMAHPEGEIATSRGAAANNTPMVLSTYSSQPLEDVIGESTGNPYVIQILFHANREITRNILQRAEAAGYRAAFVSVDVPVLGIRLNEYRNSFAPPAFVKTPNIQEPGGRVYSPEETVYDPRIEWDEASQWLRQNTKLQIWAKGVTCPEDVEKAIRAGFDGVVISNHGGRQLDGMPSTIDILRQCAPVAKGKIAIAVDGGFRRGSDIFKAIALGADICFSGRVPIWGLAYKGSEGVSLALKILQREFEITMALTGCRSVSEISPSHLSIMTNDGILARL